MRRVLTHTSVINDHEIRYRLLHRFRSFLHNSTVVPSARCLKILISGNSKQNNRRNPQIVDFLRVFDDFVHRELINSRHRGYFLRNISPRHRK